MSRKDNIKKESQSKNENIFSQDSRPLKIKVPQNLGLAIISNSSHLEELKNIYSEIRHESNKAEKAKLYKRYKKKLKEHRTETGEVIKAVEVYLFLKSVNDSGNFRDTMAETTCLASKMKLSYKTFKKRLNVLKRLQFIKYTDKYFHVCCWEDFAQYFTLKDEKKHLKFKYVKFNVDKPLRYILKSLFMQEKETQCEAMAKYKLNKNLQVKHEIEAITGGSTKLEAVKQCQFIYFLLSGAGLDDNEYYLLKTVARADTSISYRKWSQLFGYGSKGGFKYLKSKLEHFGLIGDQEQAFEIPRGTLTTHKQRKSNFGEVIWHERERLLKYHTPNKISYFSLNSEVLKPTEKTQLEKI